MHPISLLQGWFERNCSFSHRARRGALLRAVAALLRGGTLTLSQLGRSMHGALRTKHKIKCIDRLLGNAHLHRERLSFYQTMAHWLLVGNLRPVVLVDWSDCEPGHRWLMLTAAVAVRGRAITVYEEVHPLSRYNSPRTHRRFLRNLRDVLPPGCRPILVSDAGFRGPWFRAVEALGWDWVGRVRNRVKVRLAGSSTWIYTDALYATATPTMRCLGEATLSHKNPYTCRLYLGRLYQRGPGRPRKRHGSGTNARRCRKLHKDPWLLATSLPEHDGAEKVILSLYASRMQIEETFRDLKGTRWGLRLVFARSRSTARREVLLLIGTLATFLQWLVGLAARAKSWAAGFQANTERKRPVLSIVFLGRECLRQPHLHLDLEDLFEALQELRRLIRTHSPAV